MRCAVNVPSADALPSQALVLRSARVVEGEFSKNITCLSSKLATICIGVSQLYTPLPRDRRRAGPGLATTTHHHRRVLAYTPEGTYFLREFLPRWMACIFVAAASCDISPAAAASSAASAICASRDSS